MQAAKIVTARNKKKEGGEPMTAKVPFPPRDRANRMERALFLDESLPRGDTLRSVESGSPIASATRSRRSRGA